MAIKNSELPIRSVYELRPRRRWNPGKANCSAGRKGCVELVGWRIGIFLCEGVK
jgi:hypothetical protein